MTEPKNRAAEAVLSLSGGLDSTVLCASLLDTYGPCSVCPVFFRYGSKHNPWEEAAAENVATHYGLALTIIDMSATFANVSSALLASDQRPIPRAAYDGDSMALTLVPGRNLLFAAALAAIAESRGIPRIALATHSGDHHLYPDCRPAFNDALHTVIRHGTDGAVSVITPFASRSKADIVAMGLGFHVPFHLTRSCYDAGKTSCGKCGTCIERLAAFAANGVKDPIAYVS